MEPDDSNTAENSTKKRVPGKPFEKNRPGKKDPRINRLGRPKGFDEARKAAIAMFNEKVVVNLANGERVAMSRFEMLMMDWITSRNYQKQSKAFEVAYGKGTESVLLNLDLRTLTNSQLERLAAGEDVYKVLMTKE